MRCIFCVTKMIDFYNICLCPKCNSLFNRNNGKWGNIPNAI